MFNSLKIAFGFLTVLPVRLSQPPQPGDLGRAAPWFPLVGLLIGLVNAAGFWLFSRLFPDLLAAGLTVALWVIVTGGLHLDGLADCCDGLLSARTPERRLEIMRDSRLGTFGVVGLILFLVIKILTVDGLPAHLIYPALILAPTVGRTFLLPAGLLAPARSEGMGVQFQDGLTRKSVALTALIPLIGLLLAGWLFPAAAIFAALAAAGALLFARSRIGGLTGDVLGLLVEVSELVFLLFLNLRVL